MSGYSDELIEHYSERLIRRSGYDDETFTTGYDEYRPAPPAALLEALALYAGAARPRLVVDLGSGTGLSTRPWADRAEEVVGVEANAEMKARAEARTEAANVRYVQAYAQATGLPDGCADVVTCSQSFHWMEPEPTLAEAARILRSGGVFAAYDYDWPPAVHWEVDAAFDALSATVGRLRAERGHPRSRYRKDEHLARIRASGHFRYGRELVLHGSARGDANRLLGMLFSLGPMMVLLREGVTEEELGLARLREVVARVLGDRIVEWFVCYRVRLGIK